MEISSEPTPHTAVPDRNLLSALPQSLVEEILCGLDVSDIVNCGCTSSKFRDIALSETLWLRLVLDRWGRDTEPKRWITESACGYFELGNCRYKFPGSYR